MYVCIDMLICMYICMYIYIYIYIYIYRSQVLDLPLGHYATSVITERAHRQYIYLFIYLSIY